MLCLWCGGRVVFAEDRLATLHGVMAVPEVHDHADLLLAG